jgi:hypothetical protein
MFWTVILENVSSKISRVILKITGLRHIVLHNHLFKNAGSTIDWALQQNFRDAFIDHRDDEQMRKGAVYLQSYLEENKHIKALSSHHLTMPLPEIMGVKLLTMMMLRHPIERVTSVYKFEKEQVSDTHPGVINAQKLSLRDYIHWRMRPEVGATIRNFQARKLLPPRKLGQEQISDAELSALKNQLSKTELLGLVGRFDESMLLFEERLKKIFPNIDLSYVAQNVGQEATQKHENRLERLRAEIGDETYELLLEKNREDLQLLRYVEEEVARRISKVKCFEQKLENFKARCKAKHQNVD